MKPGPFHLWKQLILRGAIALVFGVTLLLGHHVPFALLVLLFGIYALLDGVITLVFATGLRLSRVAGLHILEGLLGMAFGLDALARSAAAGTDLVQLVALWAIGTGLLKVGALFGDVLEHREALEGILRAVGGGISVLLGFFSLLLPAAAGPLFIIVLAPYAIVLGCMLLWVALRSRRGLRNLSDAGAED
jgi:uncharacterized membrane protein HdeD (DUF308 family)